MAARARQYWWGGRILILCGQVPVVDWAYGVAKQAMGNMRQVVTGAAEHVCLSQHVSVAVTQGPVLALERRYMLRIQAGRLKTKDLWWHGERGWAKECTETGK